MRDFVHMNSQMEAAYEKFLKLSSPSIVTIEPQLKQLIKSVNENTQFRVPLIS